jgi:RHS repeat-associated protein
MQTQTIVYTAFKSPISIAQGIQRVNFGYNFAQDRSVMYYGNNNPDKLLRPMRRFYSVDGTMEITQTLATSALAAKYEFTTYIGGDAYTAPALARQVDNATSSIFYLHRDHLGTILAISDSVGDVIEKRLFDAWGEILKVQNGAGVILTKLTFLERGYTGHEHLQSFKLINMNGRLYDPRLHRFLQPDNNLQEPYNTQNYNRYGYVLNNPLKYTDPTGEFTWSDFVAGVAIVVGVVLTIASVGTLAAVGASLIAAGVAHFGTAAANYFNSGSSTQGNWDASSSNAGFSFSTSVSTDFGYGGKKDVANNNNPVEGHLGVASGNYDDWYLKKIQENPNWSPSFYPFDARGYELFYHWSKGSGKDLAYKNGLWGKYMSQNNIINLSLLKDADVEAMNMMEKGLTKYFSKSGNYAMEIENGYFEGYQLLHGTQHFSHTVSGTYDAKSKSYNLNYTLKWNDRINPNGIQGDGSIARYFYNMGAKDFNISIIWNLSINVKVSDLNNNIYNNGTIHN